MFFLRTLNKYYTDNVRQFEASKEKMKIASWCLEGLALIIHLICDRYSHRIPEFLQMLDGELTNNHLVSHYSRQYFYTHKGCQEMFLLTIPHV